MEVPPRRKRVRTETSNPASLVFVNCAANCIQKVAFQGRDAWRATCCHPGNGTGRQELVGTFSSAGAARAAFLLAKNKGQCAELPPEVEVCRLPQSRRGAQRSAASGAPSASAWAAAAAATGEAAGAGTAPSPVSPAHATNYADAIYEHFCKVEKDRMPNAAYLSGHSDLNTRMRAILIDWFFDVHTKPVFSDDQHGSPGLRVHCDLSSTDIELRMS